MSISKIKTNLPTIHEEQFQTMKHYGVSDFVASRVLRPLEKHTKELERIKHEWLKMKRRKSDFYFEIKIINQILGVIDDEDS